MKMLSGLVLLSSVAFAQATWVHVVNLTPKEAKDLKSAYEAYRASPNSNRPFAKRYQDTQRKIHSAHHIVDFDYAHPCSPYDVETARTSATLTFMHVIPVMTEGKCQLIDEVRLNPR